MYTEKYGTAWYLQLGTCKHCISIHVVPSGTKHCKHCILEPLWREPIWLAAHVPGRVLDWLLHGRAPRGALNLQERWLLARSVTSLVHRVSPGRLMGTGPDIAHSAGGEGGGGQVSKTPRWPRSWANASFLSLCSRGNAWANLYRLGQPDAFLAAVPGLEHLQHHRRLAALALQDLRHRPLRPG